MFGKFFKTSFLFITLAELFSIFAYLLPDFNKAAFVLIGITFLVLSIYKFNYAMLVLLAELFIGSKGYLFYFDAGGKVISIRILFWIIIMSVWFGRIIAARIKTKTCPLMLYFKNKYFKYFLILFAFIFFGAINGYLHNSFINVFFDFNGWLYFLLIFPIFELAFYYKNFLENVKQVFLSSILWLSAKTIILFYIFSHSIMGVIEPVYRWVRTSGVGEITNMDSGFTRIFFQSHIFVLVGFFIFLFLLVNALNQKNNFLKFNKHEIIYLLIFILFISVNLISYSRSNWVGWFFGLLISSFVIIWQYKFKIFLKSTFLIFLSLIISVIFIAGIIKFPYPKTNVNFNAANALAERAGQVKNEAGVSSRWALLGGLWSEIKASPVIGRGFGSTVTYKSSDPRVLESSPDGTYTTYAFEWGWLDIWLKLGLFGVMAYLLVLFILLYNYFLLLKNKTISIFDQNNLFDASLFIGLIAICVLSFFSPYMNHPLGIGYLLMLASIVSTSNSCQN